MSALVDPHRQDWWDRRPGAAREHSMKRIASGVHLYFGDLRRSRSRGVAAKAESSGGATGYGKLLESVNLA